MDVALAVAIAACVVAVLALLTSALLVRRLRRLQSGQKAVLGGASHDMVDFAVSLQGRIDDLHRAVDEVATGLSRVDRRVDGAITNRGRPLRRLRGHRRQAVGLVCVPRRHQVGNGRDRHPGP